MRLKAVWLVSRSYRRCSGGGYWLACFKSLHGVTMGFNRRLLSRFLAVFPLVACSMAGSCLQLTFAAACMTVSKWVRSLCMIHDVQTYLKCFQSALVSSAFND